MAKKVRKLSRKELLKEDEFLVKSKNLFVRLLQERTKLTYGAVAFFALIALIGGIRYVVMASSAKSEIAFADALEYYQGFVVDPSLVKDNPTLRYYKTFSDEETKFTEAAEQFEHVITEFGSSDVGVISRLYLANCYYELEDYEKAKQFYSEYLEKVGTGDSERNFANFALQGLAYSQEMTGDTDGALETFNKLTQPEDNPFREMGIIQSARIYKDKKDTAKALELYKTFVEEYPDSRNVAEIKNIIARMEAGS